jgi:hypothetical protein
MWSPYQAPLQPRPAPVTMDDTLDNCQTHSGSLEFIGRRWKTPKSLSVYFGSKPTPSSRTKIATSSISRMVGKILPGQGERESIRNDDP